MRDDKSEISFSRVVYAMRGRRFRAQFALPRTCYELITSALYARVKMPESRFLTFLVLAS